MQWNEGLSGRSLQIASSESTHIRVMAGPGTGKTFAMIRRIARLLQDGASPDSILAVTFTRAAAADIAAELSRLDVPGAESVRATTLHALGFSILGKSQALEQTGRVPRPVLDFEKKFLLTDISDRTAETVTDCGKRLKAFSAAWARLQAETTGWPTELADKEFDRWLKRWLKVHRAMLLEELVTETWHYLRNNPAVAGACTYVHPEAQDDERRYPTV